MVDLGLRAGLSFAIGMGILPIRRRLGRAAAPGRGGDPAYRAFAAYAASTILCVRAYTAVKAAYLSTVFATLCEERNLIYLAPLMLSSGRRSSSSRRSYRLALAGGAVALVLVIRAPAPARLPVLRGAGVRIAALANRELHWDVGDLRLGSVVTLGVSLLLIALRRRRWVAPPRSPCSCSRG